MSPHRSDAEVTVAALGAIVGRFPARHAPPALCGLLGVLRGTLTGAEAARVGSAVSCEVVP
jgi:hypothetical protein